MKMDFVLAVLKNKRHNFPARNRNTSLLGFKLGSELKSLGDWSVTFVKKFKLSFLKESVRKKIHMLFS